MIDIIVTRHPALKQYLIDKGIATEATLVLDHATEEDVKGKDVAGVLPMHLAALTATFTTVELDLPLEMRGKELSLDDMNKYCKGLRTFLIWDVTEMKEED